MTESPAMRVLHTWIELEDALRKALPVCSVAPPTQPSELLSALRINRRIGPEEEEQIRALRETRNRVAAGVHEPTEEEADTFAGQTEAILIHLQASPSDSC